MKTKACTPQAKPSDGWCERLTHFLRTHTGLVVIIAAALLVELTSAGMYYAAQNIIQLTVERLVQREMNAIYLCIRNKLARVEVTVDNMEWVVREDLAQPDAMFSTTRLLVENNPSILGSSIAFVPDYYPEKGYWFEPFSGRRDGDFIETMQLGSAQHDYTKKDFFTDTMAKDSGNWSNPYLDPDGAKAVVTTYSVPVHDENGEIVAIANADISLGWLEEVMEESKLYESTQRFLLSSDGNLLSGHYNHTYREALKLVQQTDDNEGYVTMTGEQGKKQHVFFHPIGGSTDWVLINVLDDEEVFGKLRHVRLTLLFLVLAGLLLIGFIVWRTSRNLERLRQVNADKARIDSELQVANRIQQSMLPGQQIQREDVDIYGSLVPAREVGGDLFDYFIRDEKLFFCIGDVSGKGAASAMLMGVTHALFRAFSAHESDPARIMQSMNESSCRGNDSNMFVTFFLGVLDLPTGRLRYCDAGHDAPFVIENKETTDAVPVCSQLPVNANLPLGVFDDVKYGVQETQLPHDSTIFLYTDGVTEAKNVERKQFGLERLEAVLAGCVGKRPKEIHEAVGEAGSAFVGEAEQSDDLTMLAIRFTPKQFESKLSETLVLKNDIKEVARFSTFMKSVVEKLGLEKSLGRQLRLAVEEAVVNVIDYAYPAETEGDVIVKIMYDGCNLLCQIIDSGVAFDPTAKERADTSLAAEDRQIGGLGILLVRELMDTINYERADGQNVLTLIKKIS